MSDPLELEFWVVMICRGASGNWTCILWRASSSLDHQAISVAQEFKKVVSYRDKIFCPPKDIVKNVKPEIKIPPQTHQI